MSSQKLIRCRSLVIFDKKYISSGTAASVNSGDFSRTIHFKTIAYDNVYSEHRKMVLSKNLGRFKSERLN